MQTPRTPGRPALLTRARLDASPILLAGDAEAVLTHLADQARAAGTLVVTPDDCDQVPLPARAILAVQRRDKGSVLRRTLDLRTAVKPLLSDPAVVIAVSVADATLFIPDRIGRALAAELRYQLDWATAASTGRRPSRSWRQRGGLGALRAAGFRIMRL